MPKLIAVIDDEPDIVELISLHLKKAGFSPRGFENAETFLEFTKRQLPDLVVLDLMLPDRDGFDVCRYLKSSERLASVPIIMLTARTDETDRIVGLELGADDYVTKPFSPRELVARVKAVLRRWEPTEKTRRVSVGGVLSIDPSRFEVTLKGKAVPLTPTEFRILSLLASRKGLVFTRDDILQHLWEDEKFVLDRTVDVHIRNLRKRLGEAARFVKSVRGVGYKMVD